MQINLGSTPTRHVRTCIMLRTFEPRAALIVASWAAEKLRRSAYPGMLTRSASVAGGAHGARPKTTRTSRSYSSGDAAG
jgi:hypothetical protein